MTDAKDELARTIAQQLFFDKLLPPDAVEAEIVGAIKGVLPDGFATYTAHLNTSATEPLLGALDEVAKAGAKHLSARAALLNAQEVIHRQFCEAGDNGGSTDCWKECRELALLTGIEMEEHEHPPLDGGTPVRHAHPNSVVKHAHNWRDGKFFAWKIEKEPS